MFATRPETMFGYPPGMEIFGDGGVVGGKACVPVRQDRFPDPRGELGEFLHLGEGVGIFGKEIRRWVA